MYVIVARAKDPHKYLDRYMTAPGRAGAEPQWDVYATLASQYSSEAEAERVRARLPKDTAPNHHEYAVEEYT